MFERVIGLCVEMGEGGLVCLMITPEFYPFMLQ